jgi:hypothetical protein
MSGEFKVDIINDAFSKLRISGLTVSPTAEETQLALRRLENLMNELYVRNICLNYNFESLPNANSLHNMPPDSWDSIKTLLAYRLIPDFGKGFQPDQALTNQANAASSFLYASTADFREAPYPMRMPVGNGNSRRYLYWRRYYSQTIDVPIECPTVNAFKDDIDDYTATYENVLKSGETVVSYTLEVDDGLQVLSESLSTPVVNYRIKATGSDNTSGSIYARVKIVATTSTGRVITQFRNFVIDQAEWQLPSYP